MTAFDLIIDFFFSLSSLPSNTEPADVVLTAIRYKYVVKITQANRTVILVNIPVLKIFNGMTNRKVVQAFNIFLTNNGINPNLISIFHFVFILMCNFIHYAYLFSNVSFDGSGLRLLDCLSPGRVGHFVVIIMPLLWICHCQLIEGTTVRWGLGTWLESSRSTTRRYNIYGLSNWARFFGAEALEKSQAIGAFIGTCFEIWHICN